MTTCAPGRCSSRTGSSSGKVEGRALTPKLSIITPSLNQGEFIERTIGSTSTATTTTCPGPSRRPPHCSREAMRPWRPGRRASSTSTGRSPRSGAQSPHRPRSRRSGKALVDARSLVRSPALLLLAARAPGGGGAVQAGHALRLRLRVLPSLHLRGPLPALTDQELSVWVVHPAAKSADPELFWKEGGMLVGIFRNQLTPAERLRLRLTQFLLWARPLRAALSRVRGLARRCLPRSTRRGRSGAGE
jgi:hypothetical protein